jgi:hypothetical protein
MTSVRSEALPRRWKVAIVAAAAAAFIFKICLALATYGTNDVYAWERFARWSALFGSRLYTIDAAFNHPPSMIHVLAAMMWLAKTTGIAFPFWLRLPSIFADTASLWVVSRIFADRLSEPTVRWGLLLLATSPTLILVSGFHGNTDPAVMFFVLLSVWLTERGSGHDWQSGAAFGAAMCIKILPVIVLPVLFFCRPGLRRKAGFLVAATGVVIVGWSPYLFRDPTGIVNRVLGYQSIYGHWGLSWLVCQFPWFRDSWHEAFQNYGTWLVMAVVTIAAFAVNRSRAPASVYTQVGAVVLFFLAVCSGFGVQYLAWLVPWTVGISIIPVAFFTLASGAFLFLVYNWWAGGFPWYLADSNYVGDFTPHLNYFLTLCWISVIVLALAVWIRRPSFPSAGTRILLSAIAIAVFAYPMWNQVRNIDRRTYPPTNDHAALGTIRAEEDAALSQVYYRMGLYTDAVVAARTGIALDPAVLDAWNNLALACIQLQRWDEALNAANNAVRLAPNDETAIANLTELRSRQ